MNYIAHLNTVLNHFLKDERLKPAHFSLYMALFREWNINRFSMEFRVKRQLVMKAAKLGSKSTYHRCICDLHDFEYILYHPSKNSHTGTWIQMANFGYIKASKTETKNNLEPYMPEFYNPTEELQKNFDVQETGLNSLNIVPLKNSDVLKKDFHSPTRVPHKKSVVSDMRFHSPKSVPPSYNKHEKDKSHGRPLNEVEVINYFLENKKTQEKARRFFQYYEKKDWKTAREEAIKDWKMIAKTWMENEYPQKNRKDFSSKKQIDYLKTDRYKNYGEPL